jgi:hypothetical protein
MGALTRFAIRRPGTRLADPRLSKVEYAIASVDVDYSLISLNFLEERGAAPRRFDGAGFGFPEGFP